MAHRKAADAPSRRKTSFQAAVLAHIAEIDARRLFLPAGYSSMHLCCVGRFGLSEDAAFRRIRAARAARSHPAIFTALADGRLNLSAVVLLAPHLAPETAAALLLAAEHKTNAEITRLLAERFPQPDLPAVVCPLVGSASSDELALTGC